MSTINTTTIKLNDGSTLPAVGLGTSLQGKAPTPEEAPAVVASLVGAIKAGYRLIDTSMIYGTEAIVGEAVRTCGIPRSEIKVSTKLWQTEHGDVKKGFQRAFDALKIGYIDLFIMHWPHAASPDGTPMGKFLGIDQSPTFVETWKQMEELVGPKCRSIGVSNFTEKTLGVLLKECKIIPAVNQIEVHPLNPNLKLVPWCQERGVAIEAWGPLAGGPKSLYTPLAQAAYKDTETIAIAKQHNISLGQVILSWLVQRDIIVLPQSGSPARLAQNLTLVKLSEDEMEKMNTVQDRVGKVRIMEYAVRELLWDEKGPNNASRLMAWTKEEIGWEDSNGQWLT